MPEGPGIFSFGQIALSAAIGGVLSLLVVRLYGRWSKPAALAAGESLVVAALAGLSILLWRLAANTPSFNEDLIPLVSPNDLLCPVLTDVILGLHAGMSRAVERPGWGRLRALLTITSLIVNVVTI